MHDIWGCMSCIIMILYFNNPTIDLVYQNNNNIVKITHTILYKPENRGM